MNAWQDIEEVQLDSLTCLTSSEVEVQSHQLARLREDAALERARFQQASHTPSTLLPPTTPPSDIT